MQARLRVLGVVFLAGALLVPVSVAAGAEEFGSASVSLQVEAPEGNPDLWKVSSHLLAARSLDVAGASASDVAAATAAATFSDGLPLLELRFDVLNQATISLVERIGFRSIGTYPEYGVMSGYAELALLDELAAIPELAVIHPEYGAAVAVGATTSQADVSINADDARSEFGVDGTGIKVGVLSDSFNTGLGGSVTGSGCAKTVTGMTNQLTGDLPPSVTLLENGAPGSDEGAAMGELITDLAPGADILFHTAFESLPGFAAGIDELVACGSDVIVDDVIYFAEPMFQDGFIAQAAQDAVDAGVSFFSSAGNHGKYGVHETFVDSDPGSDGVTAGDSFHDFGGGDRFGEVTLDPGEGVRLVLQWAEPHSGTLGPGSAINLDLLLLRSADPSAVRAASGSDTQGCSAGSRSGDPFEILTYDNNSGSTETLYMAVDHLCGSEDIDFRVAPFRRATSITTIDFEASIFNDAQVYGHAAAEGVGAVGAVWYEEIDAGGAVSGGPEINVEGFSAMGGDIPVHFGANGTPVPGTPLTRFKPEIAAPDGTNTTFFGSDSDGDSFPNFFGTSAAAPHAAAVAALMLDRDPTLTPAQVMSVLRTTAVDIEAAGRDNLAGDGLIDARDAVNGVTAVDKSAPTWLGGNLTFSNVTGVSATASWSGATDNVGVTSYRVYVDGDLVAVPAASTVDLAGLSSGISYAVVVEAVDAVGNRSTTGPGSTLTTRDDVSPTWPGGSTLTVSNVEVTTATASWTAASDNAAVASYNVYLNGSLAGTSTTTSLDLTGLAGDTTFSANVEAVDGAGNQSSGGPTTTFTTKNPLPPGGSFTDDNGNIHEPNIEAIAAAGITKGCNPPTNSLYCPAGDVTRGQMAAFLVRALGLADDGGGNKFVDDDGSIFESDIAKLAAAGVTRGCNPPTNDRFCPDALVTRGQMAAFLVRALGLADDGGGNKFVDDDGSIFESDIAKLAAAGVTKGCNPPTNDRFCPTDPVKRDQMASFLTRALSLSPITPPQVQTFGDGVWTVPGQVPPGTYRNSDSSSFCYWARLSGFSGDADIIETWLTNEIDIVTIKSSDVGFESDGCGVWSTDLSPRTASPTAAFGGGTFLVGSEVAPGTWRNTDSSGSCYWERLSGFGGALGEIIGNAFSTTIQTVTVGAADVGFSSERCGTWSKVG